MYISEKIHDAKPWMVTNNKRQLWTQVLTKTHKLGFKPIFGSLIEIIESTGFDIIGGGLGENLNIEPNDSYFNNWLNHGKYRIQKGAKGYCVKREFGFHGKGFQYSLLW